MASRRPMRRNANRSRQRKFLDDQLDWQIAHYIDQPTEPLDAEQVEAIHQASLDVIENIGILFLNDEACDILA